MAQPYSESLSRNPYLPAGQGHDGSGGGIIISGLPRGLSLVIEGGGGTADHLIEPFFPGKRKPRAIEARRGPTAGWTGLGGRLVPWMPLAADAASVASAACGSHCEDPVRYITIARSTRHTAIRLSGRTRLDARKDEPVIVPWKSGTNKLEKMIFSWNHGALRDIIQIMRNAPQHSDALNDHQQVKRPQSRR